jgi:hypothetical protein
VGPAWVDIANAQHHRAFRWVEVERDDVFDLLGEQRSLLSFHVSCRCGCRPNARQIREIAVWVNPTSAAIDRVDQCVASFGEVSSVLVITRSTSSSLIVRGRPGRGSSSRPSSRYSTNRFRHFRTVPRLSPSRAATSMFVPPFAASSTIRDRLASACALVGRRAHDSN